MITLNKTLIHSNFVACTTKITNSCSKSLQQFYSFAHSLSLRLVKRKELKTCQQRIAAFRDVLISPVAETKVLSRRERIGVLLVFVAPFIKVLYKVFPENGFGETLIWGIPNFIEPLPGHFYTLYYWFWSIGEIAWTIPVLLGIYLVIDRKSPLLPLVLFPLTYAAMHTLNRVLSSNLEEFHAITSVVIYFPVGFMAMWLLTKVLDRALHEKHHGNQVSTEKRIIGIVNLPEAAMSWDEKVNYLKILNQDLNKNSKQ